MPYPIPAPGGAGIPPKVPATLIVAASDSKDTSRADYVCDGTDDQEEINQAISDLPASGGRVVLLEGTYTISGTINVSNNVTLEGQGGGSLIKFSGDFHIGLCSYCKICNLKIDCQNLSSNAIHQGSSDFNSIISDLIILNSTDYAISIFGSKNKVSNVTVYNCKNGINLSKESIATGNVLYLSSTPEYGIRTNGVECIITSNYIENPKYGIYNTNAGCVISNNNILHTQYGIYNTGGECVISGNTIEDVSLYGIYVSSYGKTSVIGNSIELAASYGIENTAPDIVISGNVADNVISNSGNNCIITSNRATSISNTGTGCVVANNLEGTFY